MAAPMHRDRAREKKVVNRRTSFWPRTKGLQVEKDTALSPVLHRTRCSSDQKVPKKWLLDYAGHHRPTLFQPFLLGLPL